MTKTIVGVTGVSSPTKHKKELSSREAELLSERENLNGAVIVIPVRDRGKGTSEALRSRVG